jgi:hypothetical protein
LSRFRATDFCGLGLLFRPLLGLCRACRAGCQRGFLALQICSPSFAFGSYAMLLSHGSLYGLKHEKTQSAFGLLFGHNSPALTSVIAKGQKSKLRCRSSLGNEVK